MIYAAWAYVNAFVQVVVLNCLMPVNWSNCWPPGWLAASWHDYIRSKAPYQEERLILQSLKPYDFGMDEHQANP